MSVASPVIEYLLKEARASGLVNAVALGGSHAAGTASADSDVDLFLAVPDVQIAKLLTLDTGLAERLMPSGTRVGVPRFVPGYGVGVNALTREGEHIDLFFVGSVVDSNPHRSKNVTLYGGEQLTSPNHHEQSSSDPRVDIEVLRHDANDAISRGRHFDALYRLSRAIVLEMSTSDSGATELLDAHPAIVRAVAALLSTNKRNATA